AKAQERIRKLERENAQLKAKMKAIHMRQFKPNRKLSDKEKNQDAARNLSSEVEPQAKKRGAPAGHPGWSRSKPPRIDRTVQVAAPEICPSCHSNRLTPLPEIIEHIQEDIVLCPRPVVTRYLHNQAYCHCCRQPVVKSAESEILNAPIGPVTKAAAIYLRYNIGISYRKVQRIFNDLFGLTFVPASLVGFDRKASGKGSAIYDDLLEKIRASDVVHADETSWRNNGFSHFVWFAGNENLAFFHIDRHRSSEVARFIFGKNFAGTLVRDRYAAYNEIGNWQSCLSHLIRKAEEINQEHNLLPEAEKDKNVEAFCAQAVKLLQEACSTANQLLSGLVPWSVAPDIEIRFVNSLNKICECSLSFKPAQTLQAYRAGPDQKCLFTCFRIPGVPPTNNHAEQSLRHLVIFRKICF
ncbi:MAG: transposase, partial [Saprospiraceae bacterium]|nr:transposase [Saprospiraceae bacterium]